MNKPHNFNIRPELKIIAESLKALKDAGVIRSKKLVGDLGEYYCQEFSNLTLNGSIVETGFDAIDRKGEKVEIKTRRLPSNQSKVIFRGFDFDYCLYVELNEFFEPTTIIRIKSSELRNNTEKKGDRISVGKLKNRLRNEVLYTIDDKN